MTNDTPAHFTYRMGDLVRKTRGSAWRGTVCGWYSTDHTPEGYNVNSAFEPGSVQCWPLAALAAWDGRDGIVDWLRDVAATRRLVRKGWADSEAVVHDEIADAIERGEWRK